MPSEFRSLFCVNYFTIFTEICVQNARKLGKGVDHLSTKFMYHMKELIDAHEANNKEAVVSTINIIRGMIKAVSRFCPFLSSRHQY